MLQKQRQGNMELLRCFAMLCIIVYHLLLFALGNNTGTKLYQALQIPLHIGVPLFVLISGYFGIHFSLRGLMRLCSKAYIYFIPLGLIPALIGGQEGIKDLLKHVFILGFDAQWYLNTYLYLFLFSPILNRYLIDITNSQRMYLLLTLAFMSIYIGNVTEGDVSLVEGKNLTNFILLYVIGNTIRNGQQFINMISQRKLICGYVMFNVLLVLGFMYIPILSGKIWKYSFAYNSPIIMLNSIWVFAIFSKLHISSKLVNWAGRSIFACYLLQCPSVVWKKCFEHPIRQLYAVIGEPYLILPAIIIFALCSMLVMICIDKALSPLWRRLVVFAAGYDAKWNTKQLC